MACRPGYTSRLAPVSEVFSETKRNPRLGTRFTDVFERWRGSTSITAGFLNEAMDAAGVKRLTANAVRLP
jgi:hypothetical protein